MAGEITQNGQLAVYGGNTISIIDSDVGFDAAIILARQGAGLDAAWKSYVFGQADFLNTLTELRSGDHVMVIPKSLPMDFPLLLPDSYPITQSFLFKKHITGPQVAEPADLNNLQAGNYKVGSLQTVENATLIISGRIPIPIVQDQIIALVNNDLLEMEITGIASGWAFGLVTLTKQ